MMIEADVTLGTHKLLASQSKIPVMAHPPITSSDLSLEEFLDMIINYHKPKGIKLDIKDIDVLEKTLEIIKARQKRVILFKGSFLVPPFLMQASNTRNR